MVDFGYTEKRVAYRMASDRQKNQLLQELANSLGDIEMYRIARELKQVIQELEALKRREN